MKTLHNKAEMEAVLQQAGTHMFLFTAPWCPDCVYIKPFMPALEKKYADKMDFYQLDRDECLDLAIELGIMGIPSFVAYKNGKQINSFVSSLRKTQSEIDSFFLDTVNKGE